MGDDNSTTWEEAEREVEKNRAAMMRNYSERNVRRLLQRENANRLTLKLRRAGQ